MRTDAGRGQAAQLAKEFPGILRAVVLAAEEDVLDRDAAVRGRQVLQRREDLRHAVAAADGHETDARLVVAGVQADRDSHLRRGGAQAGNLLGQAHRGHGDPARRDAEALGVGQESERTGHSIGIEEGFAHSHVDDVPPSSRGLRGSAFREEDLGGDLAGREIPTERDGARAAEGARQGAADLGRDTDRQVGGVAARALGSS